ncbi:endonuclease [Streptomyces sp. SL13]|uniref:Endonuclease n=1 Tax=Streptantibioticus silvisoli TaxID=2705255 RepID=A0AA90K7Z5_9ACTN|nr:endonuclease [Streptantibioticus silvisoli]MDI5968862.1 endonuclease [Streptantibioticus silvisoli]
MATKADREKVEVLLASHGRTYAEDAGVRVRNTPQPLYQLLVLAHLLSARIKASVAGDAARALFAAGMRDPRHMADATWQQRVDALGEGHYRRYDERTATQLGDGAELLLEQYGGDLRNLRDRAGEDVEEEKRLLREMPGVGPVGADIFLREAQGVWPEAAPYFDGKAVQGATRLGLPESPRALARLADPEDYPALAAGLVRSALDQHVADDIAEHAAAH